mgnify:CR=1 FL=1
MLMPDAARAEVRARGEALLLHHGSGAELEVQLHARLGAAPAAAPAESESPAARPTPSGIPTTVPAIKFYPFTTWRTDNGEQVSEIAAATGLRLAVHVREEADGHFSIRMEASAAAAASAVRPVSTSTDSLVHRSSALSAYQRGSASEATSGIAVMSLRLLRATGRACGLLLQVGEEGVGRGAGRRLLLEEHLRVREVL